MASRDPDYFLFDNGSLRGDSTLSLRRAAGLLAEKLGQPVRAVSLLHSSAVAAELLEGEPARLLEPALLEHFAARPDAEVVLAPLFFGPSEALTSYVPERVRSIMARFPRATVRLAPPLVDAREGTDFRVARVLADRARETAAARGWTRPKVVLVDHGSPRREVTAVRDHLAAQLRALLGGEIDALAAASMERREGIEFAFNEPLLETILRTPPFDSGRVVIVMQFLSPGRHAGPAGDVAAICAGAKAERPGLETEMTPTIAMDPRIAEVLADRIGSAERL